MRSYSGQSLSVALLGSLAALGLSLCLSAPADAAPSVLWQVPSSGVESGPAAANVRGPLGVAADPNTGDVYVADATNDRIDQFTAFGMFVRAFGWNVDASAPEEKLQVCTTDTGCKAGAGGGGDGQFAEAGPSGMAVGPEGSVFAFDYDNHRVEKFSATGEFLLMFGGDVNRTKVEAGATDALRNRCPVDPADVCQAGTTGSGDGQFGGLAFSSRSSDYLAVGSDGTVFVGDVGRIEEFDSDGVFQGEISFPKATEVPGGVKEGEEVSPGPLAVSGVDTLYFSLEPTRDGGVPRFPDVYKHTPDGWSLFTETKGFFPAIELNQTNAGEEFAGAEVEAIAVDSAGNVYLSANPAINTARILEFDSAGQALIPNQEELRAQEHEPPVPPFPFGERKNFRIPGLETSSACGISGSDLFASYNTSESAIPQHFVAAYGPNPNPTVCPPPPRPPSVTAQFAISVGEMDATVKGEISSHFWPTTRYYVEYGAGKCSEGGCTSQPAPPGLQLGSQSDIAVPTAGVELSGLAPGTTYHYRLVAITRFDDGTEAEVRGLGGQPGQDGTEGTFTTLQPALAAQTECPNQQFRDGTSARLPDCRAYELVSPVDKAGGDIATVLDPLDFPTGVEQSAASGERLTFSSSRAFGAPRGAPFASQYLAVRGEAGWESEGISPGRGRAFYGSPLFSFENEYKAFSADLCQSWLRLESEPEPVLDPAAVPGYPNLYRREDCDSPPAVASLTTVTPATVGPDEFFPELQGVSTDGRCAVFRSQGSLTQDAPDVGPNASLYENCGGSLSLVAVLPDGAAAPEPSSAGTPEGAQLNPEFQGRSSLVQGAVSDDGSNVYWTALSGTFKGPGQLFVRLNADRTPTPTGACEAADPGGACTLPVSTKGAATFWAASPDGSRAIYSDGGSLFEFTVTIEEGEPVGESTRIATGLEGVLGVSNDANRVYFASSAVLAGENLEGASPVAGGVNLYYQEAGGADAFIGTLSPKDVGPRLYTRTLPITTQPFARAARVTPDGLRAVFTSVAPLTGYDSTDQASGESDAEVFMYSAGSESLVCVSCVPGGARPSGRNIGEGEDELSRRWAAATIPTWGTQLYASRVVSDDGSYVFFDSFTPLVARDTNGKADVYEWEAAASAAACERMGAERYVESAAGCISLISSGDSPDDSEFVDASTSGHDVFFATAASLLPRDPGSVDIYDARAGGGFPPPVEPVPCQEEGCQLAQPAPVAPAPVTGVPGPGNPKPSCGKNRRVVKKHGKRRCVLKKRHRSGKHSRGSGNRNPAHHPRTHSHGRFEHGGGSHR